MGISKSFLKASAYGIGYLVSPPVTEAIRTKKNFGKIKGSNVFNTCLVSLAAVISTILLNPKLEILDSFKTKYTQEGINVEYSLSVFKSNGLDASMDIISRSLEKELDTEMTIGLIPTAIISPLFISVLNKLTYENHNTLKERIKISFPMDTKTSKFIGTKLLTNFTSQSKVECNFSRSKYQDNTNLNIKSLDNAFYRSNSIEIDGVLKKYADSSLKDGLEKLCTETRDSVIDKINFEYNFPN